MTETAQAREGKPDGRGFWQARWRDHHELMYERLLAAISDDRDENAYCPRCRGRVELKAPDPRAITDAISKWHELAGLKPRPDDGAAAGTPPVTRRIVIPEGEAEGGQAGSRVGDMPTPAPEP